MRVRVTTLTVNPAVDMAAQATSVRPGHKVRTFGERYDPGGGGINVARVISELGGEALALLASGGVTGRFIEEMLTTAKVPRQVVRIQNACRISVTVRDQSNGQEYRFVPLSPELTPSDCTHILDAVASVDADWLVASGSLPPGVPVDFYREVALAAAARRTKVCTRHVRSCSQGVTAVRNPFAEAESHGIRSDRRHAGGRPPLTNGAGETPSQFRRCADGRSDTRRARGNSSNSRSGPASPGDLCLGADRRWRGDSFLAGLIFGLAKGQTHEKALRLALACGASAVRGIGTAQVRRAEVETLLT